MSDSSYHRFLRVLRDSFLESRPVVQFVFALRFLVGALCAVRLSSGEISFAAFTGMCAWVCAVMSAYVLNGAMDVTEDRANGSRRPIASGRLPVRSALTVVRVLAGLSLLVGVLSGLWWLAIAFAVLGCAYSVPPVAAKRNSATAGLVVIAMGLTTYLAGAVSTGGRLTAAGFLFCLVMSLWMGFVGAITKDLSDVHGDAVSGRRTLAVVKGERFARFFAGAAAVALGGGAMAAAVLLQPVLLGGTVPLAAGAVWLAVRCLRPAADRRGPYRAFMVTQYAANIGMLAGLLLL
ncbi:UbiA family prenyltransferase [Streptomyces griseus]|uniref:UbiA family prenyltransferase n=1 Tax=Streptomyces griseus TaxID=1911 RepID=UPI0033DD2FB8